jgi:hypothetical protein
MELALQYLGEATPATQLYLATLVGEFVKLPDGKCVLVCVLVCISVY